MSRDATSFAVRALCIVLTATVVNAQEEPTIPPANDWYQSELAPLFGDKPWDRAAELSAHFSETIQIHGDSVQTVSTFEWLTEVLQELKIAGWIRSEIADVDSDQLNSTTVAFKTKWRDYYSGGNISYDCTWYLADFSDGTWRITDIAGITCNEHGL